MSFSRSSSSTRKNAARWTRPSTNRSLSSGIEDKISRSLFSSASIRLSLVFCFFLATFPPPIQGQKQGGSRTRDPRVNWKVPASGPSARQSNRNIGGLWNRLYKLLQRANAAVFNVVAVSTQQLQVVRVIRYAPVAPVSLIERHDVVHFLARLAAPLSQAFLA